MEFNFVLKYQLAEPESGDALLERLGEAGCDDALVGIGIPGRVSLTFSRDADTAQQALVSALEDVKRALPGATLTEAGPDLVGLTDVAQIVGLSRQNIRKLMLGHATTFPAPMHEGNAISFWHLADILRWLKARGSYAFDANILEVAIHARRVNLEKEIQNLAAP